MLVLFVSVALSVDAIARETLSSRRALPGSEPPSSKEVSVERWRAAARSCVSRSGPASRSRAILRLLEGPGGKTPEMCPLVLLALPNQILETHIPRRYAAASWHSRFARRASIRAGRVRPPSPPQQRGQAVLRLERSEEDFSTLRAPKGAVPIRGAGERSVSEVCGQEARRDFAEGRCLVADSNVEKLGSSVGNGTRQTALQQRDPSKG